MLLRSSGMLLLWVALVGALPGCQSEDDACPRVAGVFEATYGYLNGTCPAFDPLPVKFDGGRQGVITDIQRRVNDSVETMIIFKGCTLRMTQTVINTDNVRMAMVEGESLVIENENELSGTVVRQEFDSQGQLACQGTWDAVYTKNTTTIGGAAL